MLTVESFQPSGRDPSVTQASRVLIKDEFGNPICLAVSWIEGTKPAYIVAHCGDDDFEQMLSTFGVDKVIVLNRAHVGPGT